MSEAHPPLPKLTKLPERAPVKITILINPAVHSMLQTYATLYRETYGAEEPLTELIPYMLKSFLESDRRFIRARQARGTVPKSE